MAENKDLKKKNKKPSDDAYCTSSARIEKYDEDGNLVEIKEIEGNTALIGGINLLWKLALGLGDDTDNYFFSAANLTLGVGNSSATADSDQTGLLGTSKAYKGLDQSTQIQYPVISDNVITLRAKFGPDDANFTWNEWGMLNGNPDNLGSRDPSTVIQYNRKVESMGTKVSGSTWVIVTDIRINPASN